MAETLVKHTGARRADTKDPYIHATIRVEVLGKSVRVAICLGGGLAWRLVQEAATCPACLKELHEARKAMDEVG